jgi:hypothetical protein
MMSSCGTRANVLYVMMQFLSLPTLMRQLVTRFDGLQLLPNICPSFKVVLGSLMGLSSKFIKPRSILFVDLGLIDIKRCTT